MCGRRGHMVVNFQNCPDRGGQGISVVVAVKRVKQGTVFPDQSCFGGRGTGIDTQVTVSFISIEVGCGHVVAALALVESVVLFLRGKEGFHSGHFKFQLDG